jgi:hypothetical protein
MYNEGGQPRDDLEEIKPKVKVNKAKGVISQLQH